MGQRLRRRRLLGRRLFLKCWGDCTRGWWGFSWLSVVWGKEVVRAGVWREVCIITSIRNIERLLHLLGRWQRIEWLKRHRFWWELYLSVRSIRDTMKWVCAVNQGHTWLRSWKLKIYRFFPFAKAAGARSSGQARSRWLDQIWNSSSRMLARLWCSQCNDRHC